MMKVMFVALSVALMTFTACEEDPKEEQSPKDQTESPKPQDPENPDDNLGGLDHATDSLEVEPEQPETPAEESDVDA